MFKEQIELAESMGAKAPQELMLVSKQVSHSSATSRPRPDYQMMRDLYLTKNIIPETKNVAAERGVVFPT